MIDVRAYLDEGGKLFFTGKNAGYQYGTRPTTSSSATSGSRSRGSRPRGRVECTPATNDGVRHRTELDASIRRRADQCIQHNDDFLQYYLGAYIRVVAGGSRSTRRRARPFGMAGTESGPFDGLTWLFDETGAGNQNDHTTSTS